MAATAESVYVDFNPPPISCTPNPLRPRLSTLAFNNMTFTNNTAARETFHALYYNTTANYMHAMLSAVRLDFGNRCPNYLTDPTLINDTFLATPDLTSDQYPRYFLSDEMQPFSFNDIIRSDNVYLSNIFGVSLPVYDSDEVFVTAPYLCHLTVRKSVFSLLVALAIGISSLYSTVWSGYNLLAPWLAPRMAGVKELRECYLPIL